MRWLCAPVAALMMVTMLVTACGSDSADPADVTSADEDPIMDTADVTTPSDPGPQNDAAADVAFDAPFDTEYEPGDLGADPMPDPGQDLIADANDEVVPDPGPDLPDVLSDATDIAEVIVPLYPATAAPGWRVIFGDEFNGRPCDPGIPGSCPEGITTRIAACFGSGTTAAPTNLQHSFHAWPGNTVKTVLPHLMDLDKCIWSVNDHVNWIHFTGTNHDELIAQYHPDMISVARGELLVGTKRVGGTGPCGTNPDPESPVGQACPYRCGAVTSTPFNGSEHAFPKPTGPWAPGDGINMPSEGRIDIRAKMPFTNGNMAALWTWAVNGEPFEQEHDILEYFVNWRNAHHQGDAQYQPGSTSGKGAWIISDASEADYRYHEFHVYSMEWMGGNSLRYLFDGHEVVRLIHGEDGLFGDGVCRPLQVQGNPFFLIFWNLLVSYSYAPSAAPYGDGHPPDWMHVDWVRLYEACTMDEDRCIEFPNAGTCENPCEGFGAWEDGRCIAGQAPVGRVAAIIDGQYGYTGDPTCASGGTPNGGGCVLGAPPPGRTPSLFGSKYVASPVCQPTEGIYNCARPCPQNGATVTASGCALPGGARVPAERCAYGGTYNEAEGACLFLAAPLGQNAFTWAGGAYYKPFATEPRCDTDAGFDGANCYVGPLPTGADDYVEANRIWLRPTCGPVTPPGVFFANTEVSPDEHPCP